LSANDVDAIAAGFSCADLLRKPANPLGGKQAIYDPLFALDSTSV